MEKEALIGLELHLQLNTKAKLFSSSKNSFGDKTNSNVFPLDIALPGSQPTLNFKVVEYALMMAKALHMEIAPKLVFDRKNYFYSDLAKGYQITQHKNPLGKNGHLIINNQKLRIAEIHIEEDTAKQIHNGEFTYIDYNRSGVPLLEIVFEPDIRDPETAKKCVQKINKIAAFLNISEGKLENGTLRCDVNVSLRDKGSNILNNKTEIKNLNSYKNIIDSINLEIRRQESLANVESITFTYDETKKELVQMREKTTYRYIIESNIPPVKLSEEFLNKTFAKMNTLPDEFRNILANMSLNDDEIENIISSYDFTSYFLKASRYTSNTKLLYKWMNGSVREYLNKNKANILSFPIDPFKLSSLINLIDKGFISNEQAKTLFEVSLTSDKTIDELKEELGLSLNSNEEYIKNVIKEILNRHNDLISEYNNGNDHILKYLMGQLMKETKGNINPSKANELLLKELNK